MQQHVTLVDQHEPQQSLHHVGVDHVLRLRQQRAHRDVDPLSKSTRKLAPYEPRCSR